MQFLTALTKYEFWGMFKTMASNYSKRVLML